MAVATYKDLCIDAVDPAVLGRPWAGVLHLGLQVDDDGDARLVGPMPRHTVWVNAVPEPVTVERRVHLDVRADSVGDVVALGGVVVDAESFSWTVVRVLRARDGEIAWNVLADPDGNEFCAFVG